MKEEESVFTGRNYEYIKDDVIKALHLKEIFTKLFCVKCGSDDISIWFGSKHLLVACRNCMQINGFEYAVCEKLGERGQIP